MRLAPGEEDAVRQHLVEQLKPLSEAEPEVLADYVMVLVEKDVPKDELRENCVLELSAFLQESTEQFVSQLFSDLDAKPWKKDSAKQESKSSAREQPERHQESRNPTSASSGGRQEVEERAREASPEPEKVATIEDDRTAEGWDDLGHTEADGGGDQSEGGGRRRRRETSRSSDDEDGEQDRSRRRGRSPVNDDRSIRRRTDERGGYGNRGSDRGGIYDRTGRRDRRDDDRGPYSRRSPPLPGADIRNPYGQHSQGPYGPGAGPGGNHPMAAFFAQMQKNFGKLPQGGSMGGMPNPQMMAQMMAQMKAAGNFGGSSGTGPGMGSGGGGMFPPAKMPPPGSMPQGKMPQGNMPPDFQAFFRQMQMQNTMGVGPPGMMGQGPGGMGTGVGGGGGSGGVPGPSGGAGGMMGGAGDEDYNPENPAVPELQQRIQQQAQQRLMGMLNASGAPSATNRPPPLPQGPPPGGPPRMPFPVGNGPMTPDQLQKMLQMYAGRGGGPGGPMAGRGDTGQRGQEGDFHGRVDGWMAGGPGRGEVPGGMGAVRQPQVQDLRKKLDRKEEWKKSSDTVEVLSVPANLCTEPSLREYYAKFGKVVRVVIDGQVART